jgi:transcriptional regulator with XRE-family HTH domain
MPRKDFTALPLVFSQVLSGLRIERNLSQVQLGLIGDLDSQNVSRIERATRLPSITTLYKFARALDISVAEIMRIVEQRLPDEPPPKPKRRRAKVVRAT